jgi:hypothetical protein
MLTGKPTRSAVKFDQFCFMFQMEQILKMPRQIVEAGFANAKPKHLGFDCDGGHER